MDIIQLVASRIVKEQEVIIGPIAWEEARSVKGLKVDVIRKELKVQGNQKETLQALVNQYRRLFGKASEEVCREAVRDIISEVPQELVPPLLK